MALNLTIVSSPDQSLSAGSDSFEVPAGKALIIETTPNGVEIFNEIVPEGKTWIVNLSITISQN